MKKSKEMERRVSLRGQISTDEDAAGKKEEAKGEAECKKIT